MKRHSAGNDELVFQVDVPEAIGRLARALAVLLTGLQSVGKAAELARVLSLDRALSWKIWRIVHAATPLEAVPYLLSTEGYEKLLRAAQRRGVERDVLEAVRVSAEGVSEVMRQHAGDRASLEIIAAEVTGKSGGAMDPRSVARRKACFLGNSAVWGVQAAVQYRAGFFGRSDTPGIVQSARVYGLIGLRRMRPLVKWTVARVATVGSSVQPTFQAKVVREPLDPRCRTEGLDAPVLLDFSSKPLPQFHQVHRHGGATIDVQVSGGQVGSTGDTTVLLGEFTPHAGPAERSETNMDVTAGVQIHTPCRAVVLDVYVEKGLFPPQIPSVHLFSELGVPPWPHCGEDAELPQELQVETTDLDEWPDWDGGRCVEVPQAPQLARSVFERLGWDGSRFQLHRVRSSFPPIPTTLLMQINL